jgi:hypothetical protein
VAPDDPADLLPPGDNDPPAPAPRPRAGLVCEYCECRLTPTGDVLKLSDKAKRWRDTEGAGDKLTARITALERENDDLKTKLRVATGDGGDRSLHL